MIVTCGITYMEPLTEYFIKTRKGKGKQYAIEIIECLEERSKDSDGWVQTKELYKRFVKTGSIPEGPTLFRILTSLVSYKIVERKEEIVSYSRSSKHKKKKSVFYRLYPSIAILSHYSEEEKDTALKKWQLQFLELHIDHIIAIKLIEKHNLSSEYDWMREHDEYKKKYEAAVMALKDQI